MIRLFLLGVLVTALSGCATFTVITPEKESGPDYIILKAIGNREKVYDCYSKPGGDVWDPTCVLVKYRRSGVNQERRAIRKEDRVDEYEERRRGK